MKSRETYYGAFFALLQGLAPATFTTVTRVLKSPTDLNSADYPYLCMKVADQPIAPGPSDLQQRHTLGAHLFVYSENPDSNISPDIALNGLLDAIEGAMAPDGTGRLTLGGLVNHCRIEGAVEVFSGANAQIAVAIVPVKILVP